MKHLIPIVLCAALLCGCTARQPSGSQQNPPVTPPASQAEEKISYQVEAIPYDRDVTAEDGTLLVQFRFQRPQLIAFVNGEPLTEPTSTAQQAALAKVSAFSEEFDRWISEESLEETAAAAKEQYEYMPESFQVTGMNYAEEFTYESYQMGNIVSIAGMFYSYLGGAHPNTAYSSWNFDLESGKFITLPELTEDPQVFTLAVADKMEEQAMEEFRKPEYGFGEDFVLEDIYWGDYRDVMEQWATTSAASNLGEDGMYISFSAYNLASYAAGPQFFFIPYEELDSYWSDAGRAALGLNG